MLLEQLTERVGKMNVAETIIFINFI